MAMTARLIVESGGYRVVDGAREIKYFPTDYRDGIEKVVKLYKTASALVDKLNIGSDEGPPAFLREGRDMQGNDV